VSHGYGIGHRSAIETSHSFKWLRGTTARSRTVGSVAAGQRASTAARKDTWPESARSPSLAARVRPAPATTVASPATSLATVLKSAKPEKRPEEEPEAALAITATKKATLPGTVQRPGKSADPAAAAVAVVSATTVTRKATSLGTAPKPRRVLEAGRVAATATTAISLDTWLGTVHRNGRSREEVGINRR